ncbi:MAG: 50S ribosomal protein L29 [bacterium]
MKIKEIRTTKEKDLHKLLAVKRGKLRELRFKDANKQLGNIREIRETKKDIAQILTVLNTNDIKSTVKEDVKPVVETEKKDNK